MAISDYSTTPALNVAINGINIGEGCSAPNLNDAIRQIMADLATDLAASTFPSGTVMLFAQSAAPTGWTKQTANDNAALRIVSGTAGTGGSVGFTSAFAAAGATDSHVLTSAEMPAHQHFEFNGTTAAGSGLSSSTYPNAGATGISNASYSIGGDGTTPTIGLTSSTGGSGGHTHGLTGLNLAVKYVDVIAAAKA